MSDTGEEKLRRDGMLRCPVAGCNCYFLTKEDLDAHLQSERHGKLAFS